MKISWEALPKKIPDDDEDDMFRRRACGDSERLKASGVRGEMTNLCGGKSSEDLTMMEVIEMSTWSCFDIKWGYGLWRSSLCSVQGLATCPRGKVVGCLANSRTCMGSHSC